MSTIATASSPQTRLILVVIASMASVALAVGWLIWPESYPHGTDSAVRTGINVFIEPAVAAVLLLSAGGLGLVLVAAVSRGHTNNLVRIGVVAQVLLYAFVLGDGSILSSAGYLLALLVPPAVLVLVAWLCRRRNRVGILCAATLALLVLTGIAVGFADDVVGAVGHYLHSILAGLSVYADNVTTSWGMALAAAAWVWLGQGMVGHATGRPEWILRRRRVVTIVASLGLVPYGLMRLTWLTPWPMGGGDGELFIDGGLDLATRIQGVLFVGPCAMSVVLTLGLISRWGEVFPNWFPVVGGREVPVMLAVVPGALATGIVAISAPGMFLMAADSTGIVYGVLSLLVFPFAIWAPVLGLAVYAYWLHRTAGLVSGEPG